MLTGHNTEIHHDDIAFHVQTEDKGRANPVIVSLIYVGGRVLAAKRTSYADLLEDGHEEREIAELMERQHRTMLTAIRHGRFDEQVLKLYQPSSEGFAPAPEESSGGSAGAPWQSLDEMVSEFLGTEPPASVALALESGSEVRPGEESEIAVRALLMPGSRPLADAEVSVEIISPFEPPRLLGSGRTDEDGRWRQRVEVPASVGGMAALIVAVRCPLGDAEEKILL